MRRLQSRPRRLEASEAASVQCPECGFDGDWLVLLRWTRELESKDSEAEARLNAYSHLNGDADMQLALKAYQDLAELALMRYEDFVNDTVARSDSDVAKLDEAKVRELEEMYATSPDGN